MGSLLLFLVSVYSSYIFAFTTCKMLCSSHFIWFNISTFHNFGPILGMPGARGQTWAHFIKSFIFFLIPYYLDIILPFTGCKIIKYFWRYCNFLMCARKILNLSDRCNTCASLACYFMEQAGKPGGCRRRHNLILNSRWAGSTCADSVVTRECE